MSSPIESGQPRKNLSFLQKRHLATEITADLTRCHHWGTRVDGLGRGVSRYQPFEQRAVAVNLHVATGSDVLKTHYQRAGFSDDEIDTGIIEVQEGKNQKFVGLTDERVHAVIIQPDSPPRPSSLDFLELHSIGTIATLSALPGQILDGFGDYEQFARFANPQNVPDERKDPFGTGVFPYPLEEVVDTVKQMTTGNLVDHIEGVENITGVVIYDDSRLRDITGGLKIYPQTYYEGTVKNVEAAKKALRK